MIKIFKKMTASQKTGFNSLKVNTSMHSVRHNVGKYLK